MPPPPSGAGAKDAHPEDTKKIKHPLQAVVLADSFTRTFRPISLEHPKVLLPLANVPMIEYTLEMLANAKVMEIIVVCCWHASQVAAYVRSSRWNASRSPVVRIESFPHAESAGDALRDLAITGRVQSDPFILISGDVVSNIRLAPILRAHEARPDKSKVVMTMVLRRCEQGHQLRNLDDDLVVVLDKNSRQILMYETDQGEDDGEGELALIVGDSNLFKDHPGGIEIRRDYLDCYIDICSPEVLNLLQGEFHADLRLDFVRKEVANRELDRIFYAHEIVAPTDYAARVHGLRSYDRVSKDVLSRWLYPLVPDNNWSRADGTCWFTRGFIYRESGVLVDRTAKVGRNTMLGADSQVGEGAIIEGSVLGRRCVIGPRAVVKGSYLWDGSVVKAGAKVIRAVVCSDAVIGENAIINRGCVVSFNVHVEDGREVLPFARLTTADPYENVENRSWGGSSEEGGAVEEDAPPFAQPKRPSWKQDASAPENSSRPYREYDLKEELLDDDEDDEYVPDWVRQTLESTPDVWKQSAALVMTSMGTDELDAARMTRDWVLPISLRASKADDDTFEVNVTALVSRVVENAKPNDAAFNESVAQELKSLRASREDCSFTDLVSAFVGIGLMDATASKASMKQRLELLIPVLKQFNPFKVGTEDSQVMQGLIQIVELVCLCGAPAALAAYPILGQHKNNLGECLNENGVPVSDSAKSFFPFCLKQLCDEKVVNFSAIEPWAAERMVQRDEGNELGGLFTDAKIVKFIDQLVEALKEEDEDEDDEEDDEA